MARAHVAELWCSLFAPEAPAFDWLPGAGEAVAWLNDENAESEARAAGRELWGAKPECVRRVHDKAFAHALAEREGLIPTRLRGAVRVLDAAALQPDAAGIAAVEAALASLPDWARERFTLKPRLGSSGRGRVAGANAIADTPAIRGALARLAARGGAVLEPWLDRIEDLSAQLFLSSDGTLRMLGTTRVVVTPAGLYRGQRGLVDSKGRIVSGSEHDEALREAAVLAAQAAAAEGFRGACGIDAFSFRAPEGIVLRPLLEINARFTAGTIAIGLVRRQLDTLKRHFALGPEQRLAFHFALTPPPKGWRESSAEVLTVALGAGGAGLAFGSSEPELQRALGEES